MDPIQDRQSVTPEGISVQPLPAGVVVRDLTTHTDDRGTVCELYDPRWGFHSAPMVFSYVFTTRPGRIKGWAVHKLHDDRYALLFGELELVLYDEREGSATKGLVSRLYLSERHRRLVSIPTGVWHASRNIGDRDAVVVNYPTRAYDHKAPDKYRLPLDTDRIPFRFDDRPGW